MSGYEPGGGEPRRKLVGLWRKRRGPYLHSFGLANAHAVIVANPLVVEPLHMLRSNRVYIDHIGWRPHDGTRIVLMDRAQGAVAEYEAGFILVFKMSVISYA